jgi:glycosyltransferase involved in cell wall biosynthesis
MFNGKKVVVVMPAYNAERPCVPPTTRSWRRASSTSSSSSNDRSRDGTVELARTLPQTLVHVHERNLGYGGNQKSCYRLALEQGADVVIMVHPDYQYTPLLLPAMASMIGNGLYHFVMGSRILGGHALRGGMPWWKYVANRGLTAVQNVLLGAKLSEYHTGYRAYSRELLERLDLSRTPTTSSSTANSSRRRSGSAIPSPR